MSDLPAHPLLSRRQLLKTASCGFGYMALAGLCAESFAANSVSTSFDDPLSPKQPHFPAKAKRVIFLFMRGGPTHVDTFDYKPRLTTDDGKPANGQGGRGNGRSWLKPVADFQQYGQSGLWMSSLFPHLSKHADDLCLLNGMHTDLPNHPQAVVQMHTGSFRFVRPSLGAWTLYGLGSENKDLPGFITFSPPTRFGGSQNYGSAFLPAAYQGTKIGDEARFTEAKLDNLQNPRLDSNLQRKQLDLLQGINRDRLERDQVHPELEGVIQSYELAFRMQTAVPQLLDISKESKATLDLYGIGEKLTDNFGKQCLLARRCAEAGVRFIELTHEGWDQHGNLNSKLTSNVHNIDKPIAALLTDLKSRGLLKDTLVVWGGEFGRTPAGQSRDGRDHNATGFSMWMAGGGVKGGFRYGETDDYGTKAVVNKTHIHDLNATILHLLGLNHEKLTYRYSGRDFRLTDVHGNVAHDIIA